ncbi:MAG TPA: TetR family transcriptional regulator [Solirubrobacteraceae bacterium]
MASAAHELSLRRGYTTTTIAAIAAAAGVSHETVYASFGPEPAVFRHLIETALSGADEPIPHSSGTTPPMSSPSKTPVD